MSLDPSSINPLLPRQPECGSGQRKGSYNTPLHVAALIIILVLSTLACSFPILARRLPSFPVPHRFLFLSRHFGTGVLIATAFVHLLPTAFVSLTDPCLPRFWNRGYPAMAGLIAMASTLTIVGIEMFFATRGAGHMHAGDHEMFQDDGGGGHPGGVHQDGSYHPVGGDGDGHVHAPTTTTTTNGLLSPGFTYRSEAGGSSDRLIGDGHVSKPSNGGLDGELLAEEEDQLVLDELNEDNIPPIHPSFRNGKIREEEGIHNQHLLPVHQHHRPRSSDTDHRPVRRVSAADGTNGPLTSEEQEEKKLLLQCLLLEAGILFHSVFIGLALSVATGTSFVVLLVAISFHQTFEGLALGTRIASIPSLRPTSYRPWLMALAYGTTTPLGQAIGLFVHNLYDPASQTGLLTVGIMNAISSGLLLFAGLVELLAEDFLSDKSYVALRGRKRLEACAAVGAGAMLMALVGAWA
ncbi:MAG: hypothetical protein M1823_004547 [Watsoniomyces obsoletus]|nr:MAG: hypothetical protein M1823_004547 [Watsoniomyces obsoletus]